VTELAKYSKFAPNKLDSLTAEALHKMYVDDQMSQKEIAVALGVTQGAIFLKMKKFGIESRTREDAIRLDRLKNDWTGENNPRWNGGRHITSGGSVLVRMPGHHRANIYKGYVREHILVWEKAHGKQLPDGWDVHHMNGVKDDNRPDNLVAMTSREHKHVIGSYKAHVKKLEDKIRDLEVALKEATNG